MWTKIPILTLVGYLILLFKFGSHALSPHPYAIQSRSTAKLVIKVSVPDKELSSSMVQEFGLLIQKKESNTSDSRVSTLRVKTAADGFVALTLLPGEYTVKAEHPVLAGDKAYDWEINLKVQLGAQNVLELSSRNVTVSAADSALKEGRITREPDLLALLRDGIVSVQGELGHATGFIADSSGLIITNQHVVSASKELRVQFDGGRKVIANLLIEDIEKDLAILQANLAACRSCKSLILAASNPEPKMAAREGTHVFAISRGIGAEASLNRTTISKVGEKRALIDTPIEVTDSGAPLFNREGEVIGVLRFVDQRTKIDASKEIVSQDRDRIEPSGVIAIDEARELLAKAIRVAKETPAAPSAELLPIEPDDSFPSDALKNRVDIKAFKQKSYEMEVGKYQLTLITPALKYYIQEKNRIEVERRREKEAKKNKSVVPGDPLPATHSFRNFSNWASYVSQNSPVVHLFAIPEVKATGKSMFWSVFAASWGVFLPADFKFKVNFQEMLLTCDGKPVIPIHRGRIEYVFNLHSYYRIKSQNAYAGLYTYPFEIFEPQRCQRLSLKITSEESSAAQENKVIDQRLIQQVWNDFESYRQKWKTDGS